MPTKIEWTEVPTWPGFKVTCDGQISGPSGKVLKPLQSKDGHLYVLHRQGGRSGPMRKLWVHRAVLYAFFGSCPSGMEARHLNGEPADNRWSNLDWGDRYEQREDDRRNGVNRRGATKLTLEEARAICASKGVEGARRLARIYGVSHSTILGIWSGRLWANVGRLF